MKLILGNDLSTTAPIAVAAIISCQATRILSPQDRITLLCVR